MKLPAVGGSTLGYMESPEDSSVVWESTWAPPPRTHPHRMGFSSGETG